jgi:hypothetical protein
MLTCNSNDERTVRKATKRGGGERDCLRKKVLGFLETHVNTDQPI